MMVSLGKQLMDFIDEEDLHYYDHNHRDEEWRHGAETKLNDRLRGHIAKRSKEELYAECFPDPRPKQQQQQQEGKMPRVLVTSITDCDACPWFNPGWAAVGGLTETKSLCCHPDFENERNKNRQIDRMEGREMAVSRVPDTIPEFCPLPEKEPI